MTSRDRKKIKWEAVAWSLPCVAWFLVYWTASDAWRFGKYYDYGWFVPPLVALTGWRVWSELPSFDQKNALENRPGWHGAVVLGLFAMIVPWIGARLLSQVDPAWRLPLWGSASIAVVLSHAVAAICRGWRASWSLLPVSVFALTAVPLPSVAEHALIHELTHWVISCAAWIIRFGGLPVNVHGDAMESLGRWVEVADGCSGIRSLQGFLMVALFFGVWFRLKGWDRVLMIFGALIAATVTNIARAVWLARLEFAEGRKASHEWHDASGMLAFLVAAIITWRLAGWLEDRQALATRRRVANENAAPLKDPVGCPLPLGSWDVMKISTCGVGMLLVSEAAVWWWLHPALKSPESLLTLQIPAEAGPVLRDEDAYDKVRHTLRCTSGWMAMVGEAPNAIGIRTGWFQWDNTDTGSVLETLRHEPEVCMGAIGWKWIAHHPPRSHVLADGTIIDFDATTFEDTRNGVRAQVFKAVWISGGGRAGLRLGIEGLGNSQKLRTLRMAAAIHRFRPRHARVLMGVVMRSNHEDQAWSFFESTVLPGLRLSPPSGSSKTPPQ